MIQYNVICSFVWLIWYNVKIKFHFFLKTKSIYWKNAKWRIDLLFR
jgi:hypothetical protein